MKKAKFLAVLALAFTVGATFTSCNNDDDDDDNNNPPAGLTVNTPATVVGTVDGASLNLANGFGLVGWDGGIDPDGSNINFISGIQQSFDNEEPSLNIRLGNVFYPTNDFDNATNFYNYLTTGASGFAYGIGNTQGSTTKKVNIDFTDAQGNGWGTQATSQTGSTFEITDTVHYNFLGNRGIKFRAKFNCKIFDGNTVKTLNVTDYVGAIETYQ
jgi:hypothetical protein